MKTFRKVLWVAAFLASEALLTGCKFGWWMDEYRPYKIPMVIPPKSRVYVQPWPVEPAKPINPPATKPKMLTPWKGEGPTLEPTPIPPAEAPKPTVEPNKPSSLKEREIKRATYKDEVVA